MLSEKDLHNLKAVFFKLTTARGNLLATINSYYLEKFGHNWDFEKEYCSVTPRSDEIKTYEWGCMTPYTTEYSKDLDMEVRAFNELIPELVEKHSLNVPSNGMDCWSAFSHALECHARVYITDVRIFYDFLFEFIFLGLKNFEDLYCLFQTLGFRIATLDIKHKMQELRNDNTNNMTI